MRSYDQCFVLVARTLVHIPPEDLAAAEKEVDRRLASSEDVTIAKVLLDAGKLGAPKIAAIEMAMRRYALACSACPATTYLLTRQEEKDVPCEACGAATRRTQTGKVAPARKGTGRAPTRPPGALAATAAVAPPAETDAGTASAPVPGAPAAPTPATATPATAPGSARPAAGSADQASVLAAVAPAVLAGNAEEALLDKLNEVPRTVWIVCAVIALLIAIQAITVSSRLSGYDAAIGEEILKLNRMTNDVRGKTIAILKSAGLDAKPDEIQLIVFQNIRKDARIYGYVTVRSPAVHLQVKKRLTTKESIDLATQNGFELVTEDASRIWPDGPSLARHIRMLLGFSLMLLFSVAAYKLGVRT